MATKTYFMSIITSQTLATYKLIDCCFTENKFQKLKLLSKLVSHNVVFQKWRQFYTERKF